jgi:NAD(P)-dependent dehydrogenase (short-subunit alcohol dehydrogenase family)
MSVVLITGANRGIGLELTRQYLKQGWAVIAVSRNSSAELEALAESSLLQCHELDLVDDQALADLAKQLQGQVIDVLLNNAGTMGWHNFAEQGLQAGCFGSFNRQEWHEILDINLCTPMRLAELLIDNVAASKKGRVVTISSMVGSMELNGVGGMYGYRASKAGVNAIMKSMGIDLAKKNVIAVPIHPGFVKTDMSGPMASIEATESAAGVIAVIEKLTADDAGKFFAWNGDEMPW